MGRLVERQQELKYPLVATNANVLGAQYWQGEAKKLVE